MNEHEANFWQFILKKEDVDPNTKNLLEEENERRAKVGGLTIQKELEIAKAKEKKSVKNQYSFTQKNYLEHLHKGIPESKKVFGQHHETYLAYLLTDVAKPESLYRIQTKAFRNYLLSGLYKLENDFGIKVFVDYSVETVKNLTAIKKIKDPRIKGWLQNGEVHIYFPHIASMEDINDTYIRLVVGQLGVREVLGEKRMHKLLDKLYLALLNQTRDIFNEYYRKIYVDYTEKQLHRVSAGEFLGIYATTIGYAGRPKKITRKIINSINDFYIKLRVENKIVYSNAESIAEKVLFKSFDHLIEKVKIDKGK